MSIKYKIMALVMVVTVAPLMMFFVYYDLISQQLLRSTLVRLSNQTVSQSAIALNDRVQNMEKVIKQFTANNSDLMEAINEGNLPGINNSFPVFLARNRQVKTAALLLADRRTLVYGMAADKSGEDSYPLEEYMVTLSLSPRSLEDSEMYEQVMEPGNNAIWQVGFFEDDNVYVMVKLHRSPEPLGVALFVLEPSFLLELCNEDAARSAKSYITDETLSPIAVANPDSLEQILDTLTDLKKEAAPEESAESVFLGSQLVTHQKINTGWVFVYEVPVSSLVRDSLPSQDTMLWVLGILILGYFLMAQMISRLLTRRLTVVTRKCEQVEKGNLDMQHTLKSKDEIGRLDEHFARMAKQLDVLIKQNYLQEIENKEAQLRALQYQINPHFLYNTLDIISAMSDMDESKKIREVCENLGSLFRYNTGGGGPYAALCDEISHVENYLYLQQLNYSDRFEVFYDIAPETKNCTVLKFILQPIVENAVIHGFSGGATHFLEINSRLEGSDLVVQVCDDGAGMSPERLDVLRGQIETGSGEIGIGLRNVHERIRLCYGEGYGVSIASSPEGTAVTLRLKV